MSTLPRATALLLGATCAVALVPRAGLAAEGDRLLPPVAIEPDAIALAPPGMARPEQPNGNVETRAGTRERRGLLAGGGLAVPLAETLATHLVMSEWSQRVGAAPWADVSADSIGRNLRSPWVLDDDDFWINQFGHPYQGTWSFTAARSAGLGFWVSAPFTLGASALWEIAGETTPPSLNDQVTTSVSGIVFGEILYRLAGALRAEGGTWREALATVLAPMAALNGQLLGASQTVPAPPSRWQLALGGAAFTAPGASGGREPLPYGGFSFTYGVPGSADLELERPFDHFVVDAAWTASADPAATVRARGVVAGATFDADLARGVYGAFLSFDFDTPPGHRISTAAIGFGGSASADLGGGFAVEGDAIASAILLGAAGTVDRGPDGLGRNYRFGPGEQALLAVRMLAGSRASAGMSLRQYLLLGADGGRGAELLVQGSASAAVRILGAHGVGLEVSRYVGRASVGGQTVRRADSAVRAYLTLLGGA
jgi:hypothetical protein